MTGTVNEDTLDVVWNECWKLSNALIVANELADGTSSFGKYSQAECLQLAEHFAQAAGVFMACVLVAEEKNEDAKLVEMYKSREAVFTQYGFQAGRLSGEFTTEGGLTEYLESLASLMIEHLDFHHIEPTRLHDAALQTVEDHKEDNAKTDRFGFST